MSVYPIRNIPATDHSTETALSTKLWACVSSAECGTCSCSTLLLFCILTQDAKKLSADPQRAWGEFFPPAIPLTRAGDVFMRKSLLAHVPMGRIIPPHCLHFPQLAFNGGPERIRLEKHRMVCTKRNGAARPEVPAVKAGHSACPRENFPSKAKDSGKWFLPRPRLEPWGL